MLLNKAEANILLIAGFYKAVPANLSPDLGGDTLKWLIEMNLLKLNRSKTTCRLSNKGRELLATAGFVFKPDKHPLGDSELLTRRLQSAEIALALQQIGVDVFLQDLPREPIPQTYLSAYALRINSCSNILGMAKFNGYLYTPNIVYIIYHLGNKLSGFYPSTESETFIRHARSINRDWRVLFIGGKDYKEMKEMLNRKKESKLKNDCNFIDAMNEFENVLTLPLSKNGLRMLRALSIPGYSEKVATYPKKIDNLNLLEEVLGIGKMPDLTRVPFIDRNGNGIHLGERKIYA
jgi:hypothetical protein